MIIAEITPINSLSSDCSGGEAGDYRCDCSGGGVITCRKSAKRSVGIHVSIHPSITHWTPFRATFARELSAGAGGKCRSNVLFRAPIRGIHVPKYRQFLRNCTYVRTWNPTDSYRRDGCVRVK